MANTEQGIKERIEVLKNELSKSDDFFTNMDLGEQIKGLERELSELNTPEVEREDSCNLDLGCEMCGS